MRELNVSADHNCLPPGWHAELSVQRSGEGWMVALELTRHMHVKCRLSSWTLKEATPTTQGKLLDAAHGWIDSYEARELADQELIAECELRS